MAEENRPEGGSGGNPEAAKWRKRTAALKKQVDDLEARVAGLTAERDDARKALQEAPAKDKERIAELEGLIRSRTHRDAFARLAKDKIKPDALDDAYALSGWKAESDEVDEANMGGVIVSLIESKPYLRAEGPTPPVEESTSPPVQRITGPSASPPKPVSGLGRGPAPDSPAAKPKVFRL